jgi:hypothetical protein
MNQETESRLRHMCGTENVHVPKIIDAMTICSMPPRVVLAAVPIAQLQQMGFDAPMLRERLGVRMVDLVVRESLTGELINAYGRDVIRQTFLQDMEDAVLLTDTHTQKELHVSAEQLLVACQDNTVASIRTEHAAAAVLHQLVEAHKRECSTALVFRPAHPLSMVSIDTLLRVGLGGSVLAEVVGLETARRELGDEFKLVCL